MYFWIQNRKKCQNNDTMNSSDQFNGWKLCYVETEASGTVQYVCYLNERCCEQGCCPIYNFKNIQAWYFWILLFLLCIIFFSCSWYCKKIESSRKKRLRQLANRNHHASPHVSPRENIESIYFVDDAEFKKQDITKKEESEPPPKYHEALAMQSASIVQIHYNKKMDKGDDDFLAANTSRNIPPSYEELNYKQTSRK